MPISTPVFLSPVAYPLSQDQQFGLIGPYEFDTGSGIRLWWLAASVASDIATPVLASYYSDDDGATINIGPSGPTLFNNAAAVHGRVGGTELVCCYQTTAFSSSWKLLRFDMSGSGSFGTPWNAPNNIDTNGNKIACQPYILSDDSIALIWQELIAADSYKVSRSDTLDDSTWSTRIDMQTSHADKCILHTILRDNDNIYVHTIQNGNNPFADYTNYHSEVSSSAVVAESTIGSYQWYVGSSGLNNAPMGLYDADTDSIIYQQTNLTSPNNQTIQLLIGTPSASPSWTAHDVYSLSFDDFPDYWLDFPYIAKDSSGFRVFFGYGTNFAGMYGDGDYFIYECDSSTLSGTYSAPSTIFDINTDHFPQDPVTDYLEYLWLRQLDDGTVTFTVAMMIDLASTNWCGVLGYFGLPASLTPTITCPTTNTGTLGEFFSATATASGGTPPYTYSITSGSLPPGITMTQDGTTATFSGTPLSAGSFSFTLTVEDSLGATASVDAPCPITIANTPPPEFCIITPAGAEPELVAYNEPRERDGS